ncbi:RNA polymerase-binding protein DksA [Campylobacter hepaticus]|uniref:RNA polymerase-binding protein DksA n=1 Tax=Campylobacter hepaticus TaxID=1813019 RepID=UPI0018CAD7B3|nr:RNA polymerase-binding protein DksA [Campylobacter hepaticus]MCZ0771632.1 RNA polymerase-binding protein DksA [Campylobacter hepaticus]MCZ0773100.1 RNA polymerase-binding protein DksA [Campylobacter hepaticus]MCZ0775780.1 RNA polymerase-binding protein DksA [Campylobacter hepaticus]QPM43616.1 RNA polymerase-binding protein DksA [Campylobacter hepaticus]WAP49557.1 RNA polymerase-binding protein DksA [Campylobacter hepaticus]
MTKNEIQNFKIILEERQKTIIENLHSNSKEIEALHNSVPSDSVDFSVIETGSQIDFTISTNLKKELLEIKNSLEKIKNGTYGICESCDDEIDTKRLKVKPHARYCITCRQIAEQGKKHEN